AQIAKELADGLAGEFIASASAAGPFVNLKLDRAAVFRWLAGAALDGTLLPNIGAGKTICIDYSSPNIAKHLAYHPIRSTTIGHSLAQIFRALGYTVAGINFLGDWGTTQGMVIAAYKLWGAEEPLDVEKLTQLYVKYRNAAKEKPEMERDARLIFK